MLQQILGRTDGTTVLSFMSTRKGNFFLIISNFTIIFDENNVYENYN